MSTGMNGRAQNRSPTPLVIGPQPSISMASEHLASLARMLSPSGLHVSTPNSEGIASTQPLLSPNSFSVLDSIVSAHASPVQPATSQPVTSQPITSMSVTSQPGTSQPGISLAGTSLAGTSLAGTGLAGNQGQPLTTLASSLGQAGTQMLPGNQMQPVNQVSLNQPMNQVQLGNQMQPGNQAQLAAMPVCCPVCQAKLPSMLVLWTHMFTHRDSEKPGPLACPQCGQRDFFLISHLTIHLRVHMEDETTGAPNLVQNQLSDQPSLPILPTELELLIYTCEECNTNFDTNEELDTHLKEKHGCDLVECRCEMCHRTYDGNFRLKWHINNDHKLTYDEYKSRLETGNFNALDDDDLEILDVHNPRRRKNDP